MSGVLRKHEIRHLLNAACEREEEVWKCRIENGLPKNEMPFLFAVQVTEDRGWFQKGEKSVYYPAVGEPNSVWRSCAQKK